ncbi:guanitoxin biosynthesis MBL fold metallo-hydrolase GntH [Nocardia sp. CNY236]|uniref:guanitoxin biosynthesis MBL fold metallo-hydrolase GntH n=1 Tax=Nocardia sp. CNY236 TaxID=1169152 RepID=UPI0012DEA837|nr:guanitoxin biosynthesis MBL fold metallo-hydrolase GntH [Nocardia sp. CNY236]
MTATPVVTKAAPGATPKKYPDVYVAGAEPLGPDEMRITALGTGYPARRGQGCAGFMVELGNDEVFHFDVGAGTNSAFNHMRVPYHKANKFFITHYHIDHIGDLMVYYDFGQSNGRLEPMNVFGPTGQRPELGINALVENMLRMTAWHDRSKKGQLDPRGFEVVAHEFAFQRSQVVYDEQGARVTSFPVPHGIDGAVGYRLDWNGLSMVFAGDCEPSTLTVEHSQGVDVLIHEIFNAPQTYVEEMGWTEQMAKIVAWTKHTSPQAAARVFASTRPRLAVGYHSIIAPGTPQPILDGVRTGYDGPVLLAQDFTIVNVTPQQIVSRMAAFEPAPFLISDRAYLASKGGANQDASVMHGLSAWLEDTIIGIPEIEAFKKELAEKGMR